ASAPESAFGLFRQILSTRTAPHWDPQDRPIQYQQICSNGGVKDGNLPTRCLVGREKLATARHELL
ncbi:MAG TPA: hypothetical protein VFQ90_18155, partial [Stellaceae bacterium]|nr:hypothetical protein [Stellaceae bacterium]